MKKMIEEITEDKKESVNKQIQEQLNSGWNLPKKMFLGNEWWRFLTYTAVYHAEYNTNLL